MKKRIILIIILVVVVGLAVGGYFYWKKYNPFASWFGTKEKTSPETQAIDAASKANELLGEKTSQGVLPEMNVQSNPLENKPDTNPINKTNPFQGQTNPFAQ